MSLQVRSVRVESEHQFRQMLEFTSTYVVHMCSMGGGEDVVGRASFHQLLRRLARMENRLRILEQGVRSLEVSSYRL